MKTLYSFLFCLLMLTAFKASSAELRQCSDLFDQQNSSSPVSFVGQELGENQLRELSKQIKNGEHLDQYVPVVKAKLGSLKKEIELFHDRVIGHTRGAKENRKLEKSIAKRKKLFEKFKDEMKNRIKDENLTFESIVYFYSNLLVMHEWFEHADYEFDGNINPRIKDRIKNKKFSFANIFSENPDNRYQDVLQYLAPLIVEQKLSFKQWILAEGTGIYPIEYRESVTVTEGQRMNPQLVYVRDIGHLVSVMEDYLQLKKDRQLRRWLFVHNTIKQALSLLPEDSAEVYVYYFLLNESPMRSALLKEIYGGQPLAPILTQKMVSKLDRNSPEQIELMVWKFQDFINSLRPVLRQ